MPRPTFLKGSDFEFPPAELADEHGVVSIGGLITPTTLRRAYRAGIFPWPIGLTSPMFWFSPENRFVIDVGQVHIPKSLEKLVRQGRFEIRFNTEFASVIESCASARRDGGGTWVDPRVIQGFTRLHAEGPGLGVTAHSVEAWRDGELVGGLYGVAVGACFAGESMFYREPDASKVAFAALSVRLLERGFQLIDCQVATANLARFGAREIPRSQFLARLRELRDYDVSLD